MDQIQQLIEQVGMTRLLTGGGVLVVLVVGWKLWNSGKSSGNSNTVAARCTCGWSGQASKHRPVCPRCGNRAMVL